MNVINTTIKGLKIIEPKIFRDERGYFFESYNKNQFLEKGLIYNFIQDNQSKSTRGVIRGLHFQAGRHGQTKLVRVIEGEIYDVAVDLRVNSETYGQHFGVILNATNNKQLLIPKGFAHGFSVLSDIAIVSYKCDNIYNKESESGIRFDDKILNIDWKLKENEYIVSEKDYNMNSFKPRRSKF